MCRPLYLTIAIVFLSASIGFLSAAEVSPSGVVTISADGCKEPVPNARGQLQKPSGKNKLATYYLEEAVTPVKSPPKPSRLSSSTPLLPHPKPSPKGVTPKNVSNASPDSTPPAPRSNQLAKSKKQASFAPEESITIKKQATRPKPKSDDLDEYTNITVIADPAEPVNRGTFWFNHQLYKFVLRPVSRAYDFVLPQPVRTSVYNVYDNLEFPVRFVNNLLQLNFKRSELETEKFLVNSVAGVGGFFRVSDHIPSLANVPPADTGQTFAKWGIGHGPYIVVPFLGPRSARDIVGVVGDYALNPVTWVSLGGASAATSLAITCPNSMRSVNSRLKAYDAATQNAIDPYVAIRSGYVQYRQKAASQ
jgi:phospholipid-binding lipoprotein MlaA